MRGDAYPTDTRVNANADKAWYNAQSWADVLTKLSAVALADGLECKGIITDPPTPNPTAPPTTLVPTPSPSLPPTAITPAPTDSDAKVWVALVDGSGQGNIASASSGMAGASTKGLCEGKGYARQYDDTNYVVRVEMNGATDYYTSSGEICDALGDPTANDLQWSDRADGPFQTVTVTDASTFEVDGSTSRGDGRLFPSWISTAGNGGYGSQSSSTLAGAHAQAYTLYITSLREYQPCRERIAPQTVVPAMVAPYAAGFSSRCTRDGVSGQKFGDDASICTGTDDDNTNFLYAVANNMFGTCDTMCVWDVDYVVDTAWTSGSASTYTPGTDADGNAAAFWFWTGAGSSGCWKPNSQYTSSEFMACNLQEPNFAHSSQYEAAQAEKARLCKGRCDYKNGWYYAAGSCYRASVNADYSANGATGNGAKGVAECQANLRGSGTANQASINSASENGLAVAHCGGDCYFGAISGMDTAAAAFADGTQMTYTNYAISESSALSSGGSELVLEASGSWDYQDNAQAISVLCETDANDDDADSGRTQALTCRDADLTSGNSNQILNTNSYPALDVAASGFTDAAQPGNLVLVVTVPKTMYNTRIAFENSTNDDAEYNWHWDNDMWVMTGDDGTCGADYTFTGTVPWSVFNLGGAGGVSRLATWEEGLAGATNNVHNPTEDRDATGEGVYYQFGSVMRIDATQPVVVGQHSVAADAAHINRDTYFDREVVVRVPFVLKFQKTITVTTSTNIVSTKFNYKTVAAIIQSIQYETQYFAPPYALVKLQIRTKSQYPYLFNTDENTVTLHKADVSDTGSGTDNEGVTMAIEWLADDVNCTFTNPDHMREGDVCTQEWMLYLTPHDNVCYATGEYSIEYTAGCFYGKDVCYLPQDASGADITTVTFTFKIQTSKFCPQVADEVDLAGTLAVTGRESFKPGTDGLEGPTAGSFYMQGETIHFFATTTSTKALITATNVVMVELVQDLSGLVQTGYNRVPYDATTEDITVWMDNVNQNFGHATTRVSDGTITVSDSSGVATDVVLMSDSDVYGTGAFVGTGNEFTAMEAGFKMLLHARAFPVNVDSYGSKTIVATLEVEYEALDSASANAADKIGRRRLLSARPSTDMRSRANFNMQAWAPVSMPKGLGATASMAMEITLNSRIDRNNAMLFAHSVETAMVQSLNDDVSSYTVYDSQISIDTIYSDGVRIWSRPMQGQMANRRLLALPQKIRVEYTFANVQSANAMPLTEMVSVFEKQLVSPASPLMNQPVFFGAVIHKVEEITASGYQPTKPTNPKLASSGSRILPVAILSLLVWLL